MWKTWNGISYFLHAYLKSRQLDILVLICLYDFLTFSKIYLDCPILNCKHIFRIGTPHDLLQNRALHCSGHTKSCRIRNNRQIQPTNNKYIEYGWKCSNSHIRIIRICSTTSRIMMGVLPLVDFPLDNIHIFQICNRRGCYKV